MALKMNNFNILSRKEIEMIDVTVRALLMTFVKIQMTL